MSIQVALYGGTFNPPHIGHRAVLETLCLRYERVILMPAKIPPHKELPRGTPAPEHRFAMTERLAQGLGGVEVSGYEMSKNGTCYTVDTLLWLRENNPDYRITLVVGDDMFLSLEDWYEFEKLLTLAELAVVCRERGLFHEIEQQAMSFSGKWGVSVRVLEHVPFETSSTQIREMLSCTAMRSSVVGLTDSVRSYIMEHGLYDSV